VRAKNPQYQNKECGAHLKQVLLVPFGVSSSDAKVGIGTKFIGAIFLIF